MDKAHSLIQIRGATISDAAAIASVLYESFVEFEPLYTVEGFAATTPNHYQVGRRMSEGPTWVALLADTIVGTVSAVIEGEDLYVRSMAILPGARGHGIGRLLLEQVEHFARENRCRRLFLSTTPFLHRAIHLYEHFGFARGEEEPHDLFGTPLFTMSKHLARETADAVN